MVDSSEMFSRAPTKTVPPKAAYPGGWSTGGFAGCVFESDASVEIEHCASYGNVEANNWDTGGFVGYLEKGKIRNSVSYGNVKSTVTGWEPKPVAFPVQIPKEIFRTVMLQVL